MEPNTQARYLICARITAKAVFILKTFSGGWFPQWCIDLTVTLMLTLFSIYNVTTYASNTPALEVDQLVEYWPALGVHVSKMLLTRYCMLGICSLTVTCTNIQKWLEDNPIIRFFKLQAYRITALHECLQNYLVR